jgi:hypothetical protein
LLVLLWCGRYLKNENDEISRVFLRQTQADIESSLLSIRPWEREGFPVVGPQLPDLLLTKSDGLDGPVFLELVEIDWRKIVRLSFTTLPLEIPLQLENLFSIVWTQNILKLPANDWLQGNSVAKIWSRLCNLHFGGEVCTDWIL